MKELIAFFKEIFMLSDENSKVKIGLSQFKESKSVKQPVKKVKIACGNPLIPVVFNRFDF